LLHINTCDSLYLQVSMRCKKSLAFWQVLSVLHRLESKARNKIHPGKQTPIAHLQMSLFSCAASILFL
jgi:hypothetical protein